ncbi:hypothetical protein B0O80DRAFT_497552 [Mortierella sp. GBAus27b]|nr:hypothetical protein BGX31_000580 [Mortierella sp. GBA43]KAI8356027.1 hypothetical protein B0O80DRAFT_497552 [Mortierella sp. GBAus27b]
MFDIPELDDLIFLKLGKKELGRCARVNKRWHRVVIPYLWYRITVSGESPTISKPNFWKLVGEDFLHEQWQERQHEVPDYVYRPFSSALTKYGPWIRQVSEPRELFACLSTWPAELSSRMHKNHIPSPADLLHHFYKRCPNALHVDTMLLSPQDFKTNLWKTISDLLDLRVRHLNIKGSGSLFSMIDPWKLRCVLNRLSAAMEILTLEADLGYLEDIGYQGDKKDQTEMKSSTSLKELRLLKCTNPIDTGSFWSWLWTQCGHVEALEVNSVSMESAQNLANAIQAHMPSLDTIRLRQNQGSFKLTDKQMSNILSSSLKGWKVVDVNRNTNIGQASFEALTSHFLTLQELRVDGCSGITGEDLVRVLSSCPKLHTLVAIDDGSYSKDRFLSIQAEAFIDQGPSIGTLKAWPCETSLKVLKVKIGNIPRPDIRNAINTIKETYSGQGRELQNLIYDRLGRMVNLVTLWLGHDPQFHNEEPKYKDRAFQMDCLDMSLESGLGKLSELKALRELNIARMQLCSKPQDTYWMAEHWSNLLTIYGVDTQTFAGNRFATPLRQSSPRINFPDVRNQSWVSSTHSALTDAEWPEMDISPFEDDFEASVWMGPRRRSRRQHPLRQGFTLEHDLPVSQGLHLGQGLHLEQGLNIGQTDPRLQDLFLGHGLREQTGPPSQGCFGPW